MADQQVPAYRVIGVEDNNTYSPTHGATRTKRVNYQTSDGHTSYVEIPLDKYNADTVQQLLEQVTAVHQDVMSIQGSPVSPPTRRMRG